MAKNKLKQTCGRRSNCLLMFLHVRKKIGERIGRFKTLES